MNSRSVDWAAGLAVLWLDFHEFSVRVQDEERPRLDRR